MTTPREILASVHSIAIVGLSANPERDSNDVARFLVARGYKCFGVNPALAGQLVSGIPVVATLGELPEPVDMIDIFRASEHVDALVDEALALVARPDVIWMQLGVVNQAAKQRAEAAGLTVVMDACPKVVLGGH